MTSVVPGQSVHEPSPHGGALVEQLVLPADDRSPRAIAAAIRDLIATGDLLPGTRLPTVRAVAASIGVSPATVSEAWQALRSAGVIVARGRSGSFVHQPTRPDLSPRVAELTGWVGAQALDLSRGVPDPELLPDISAALTALPGRATIGSYQDDPVVPQLRTVLEATAPHAFEAMTVVDGAADGIDRVLRMRVGYGDRVVVESPGFPPTIDLIESLGGKVVGAAVDERGMRPDALRAALDSRPRTVVLQPRAHNPTGASLDESRARELARVLSRHPEADDTFVVEDDHSALICQSPPVTLAAYLPERVVHVRGFSKSHGPDLRIAALYGPAAVVNQVVARRMVGSGWTSHILQTVLAELLCDQVAIAAVEHARLSYARRQAVLNQALRQRGIDLPVPDGINVWIPVEDEDSALVRLAADGIRGAAGAPFWAPDDDVATDHRAHVRLSVGRFGGEVDHVADVIAAARL